MEDLKKIKNFYIANKLSCEVSDYFDDMTTLIHMSDIIISRSGSSTTNEIINMGKTGLSISRSLSKSKANIIYWDDDPKVRKQITQTKFKKFFNTSKVWNTIDYVVPSPGIGIIGKSQHKLINKVHR